jgi:hypothetical protein
MNRIVGFALVFITWAVAAQAEREPGPNSPAAPLLMRDLLPRSLFRDANNTPPPPEIKAQIDKFYAQLKLGNNGKAFEDLVLGSRLAERRDEIKTLIGGADQATGMYGKMLQYELYDNYAIGSNLLTLTYLTMHPVKPLRWRFVFYRPDKAWTLMNVRFDDAIEVLVE